MKIPSTCDAWKEAMLAEGAKCEQLLRNFEEDHCIPSDIEASFFSWIATFSSSANASAVQHLRAVIAGNKTTLLMLGKVITSGFQRLFRLGCVRDLQYWLEPDVFDHVMATFGYTEHDIASWDASTARDVLDTVPERRFRLGNQIGLVWVSDANDLEEGIPLATLLDELAITWSKPGHGVILVYSSADHAIDLRVPRCLDAGCHEHFRPSPCSASTGITYPISRGISMGRKEAIHRRASVSASDIIVLPWDSNGN